MRFIIRMIAISGEKLEFYKNKNHWEQKLLKTNQA